jgi:hypothetical protein
MEKIIERSMELTRNKEPTRNIELERSMETGSMETAGGILTNVDVKGGLPQ